MGLSNHHSNKHIKERSKNRGNTVTYKLASLPTRNKVLGLFLLLLANGCAAADHGVPYTADTIVIDGVASENAWSTSPWKPLNFPIIGPLPDTQDFSANYRLLWDEDYLYLNVEMQDDVLYDRNPDPLVRYWDDDCLEIFLDEDASGGNHKDNFNAFAYHVALDGNVADIGLLKQDGSTNFILLNDHVESRISRSEKAPFNVIWELKIKVFDDSFAIDKATEQSRVKLQQNKKIGFMLAYCDNDGSETRESFIGSHEIVPVNGDKNLGYITADVFGEIILKM